MKTPTSPLPRQGDKELCTFTMHTNVAPPRIHLCTSTHEQVHYKGTHVVGVVEVVVVVVFVAVSTPIVHSDQEVE